MFKKTKQNLKVKLKTWLEIDNLEIKSRKNQRNIENLNQENKLDKKDIKHCEELIDGNWKATKSNFNQLSKKCINTYNEQQEQIDAINRTLQSVISVGADIDARPYEGSRSWAVVCIEGRCNVVKFIDLHGQDYRYILDFLKQFECSRRVIDAPYKEMFLENFTF